MENKTKLLPSVRVTESQEKIIKQAANKKRIRISDWIRDCVQSASARALKQWDKKTPEGKK